MIRESLQFFISQSLNVSVQQSLDGVGWGGVGKAGEGRGEEIFSFTCVCVGAEFGDQLS